MQFQLLEDSRRQSDIGQMLTQLELRIPPPILAGITALVMWMGAHDNAPFTRPPWLGGLVAGIAVAAGLVFVVAIATMVRARTTVSPVTPARASTLVTTGIFSVTRNPIYVADALALLAYACHLWQPQSFVAVPVFVAWIHRFQVLPEERALRVKFGAAYEAYLARTRRWI